MLMQYYAISSVYAGSGCSASPANYSPNIGANAGSGCAARPVNKSPYIGVRVDRSAKFS